MERDSVSALTAAVLLVVQASGGDIGARAGARAPILPQLRPFRASGAQGPGPSPNPPPFATAIRRGAALPGTLGLMRAYFLVRGLHSNVPLLRSPVPQTRRRTTELIDFRHTVLRSEGHARDPRAT